jgi:hypothetical protein
MFSRRIGPVFRSTHTHTHTERERERESKVLMVSLFLISGFYIRKHHQILQRTQKSFETLIISITSQRTGEIKRTTKREIKRERILERTPRKTNLYFANGCAILLLLLLLRVLLLSKIFIITFF